MERRLAVRDLLLLAAMLGVLCAWPLVVPPITTRGEAREALITRDMLEHGRWVLGYRLGVVASKPPLFHWIAAGAGRLFGASDWAMRVPSVLGAWVTAAVTLTVGTALGGRRAGWLAVGALVGTLQFWRSATEARVDMVFTAVLAVALGAFLLWYRGPRTAPPVACYLGMLCAVLTKGPAGAVLPVLVILAFLAWQRELGLVRRLWSWPLVAVAVLGGVAWYLLAYRVGGRQFLAVQVLRENMDRFVGSGIFGTNRRRTRFMLEGAFVTHLLPWNLVVLRDLRRWWRGEPLAAESRFLHVWWIVVLAFFSVAAGKRAVYLLPLYPAIALLAGCALAGAEQWRRALATAVVVLALVLLAATEAERLHTARGSLLPFAGEVRRVVPRDAALHVAPGLSENDYFVLGYLLDRPIRRRPGCLPGGYYLVPAGKARSGQAEVLATSTGSSSHVALLRCPPK